MPSTTKLKSESLGTFIAKGQREENQDALFSWVLPFEASESGVALLVAVLDGHGKFGTPCTEHACEAFQKQFFKEKRETVEEFMLSKVSDEQVALKIFTDIFKDVHEEVRHLSEASSTWNARFSGTTATVSCVLEQHIIVANVGDSDAVIGRKTDQLEAQVLSAKHHVSNLAERTRIESNGGIVEPYLTKSGQPKGPLRVWLPDVRTPGLMVSRCIGDLKCETIGVISEPSICIHEIKSEDKVLILATDGLWEFVSPREAFQITEDFLDANAVAEFLTYVALARQNKSNADNVSIVVKFLEDLSERKKRLSSSQDWKKRIRKRAADFRVLKRAAKAGKPFPGNFSSSHFKDPQIFAVTQVTSQGTAQASNNEEDNNNSKSNARDSKVCGIM